ncbi:hypothetical protein [Pyxidicoccus caerfyrddinensis]|uniref:hypothetical protein n=1 Tax=Pyxidicoccus caerfyrddinensis TaxID=2709663 RepID=UPI0013DD03D7|nr:hypothetical protein [Pyxidicoccus caerfyrddinensis]
MKRPFRIIVLGEGKDERGKPRTIPPLQAVSHSQQGAMEILVRRALYPLLNDGQPWHRGLANNDGIQVLQPPAQRLPRALGMVAVLADPNALAPLISAAIRPVRGTAPADLLIATHDGEDADVTLRAIGVVNSSLGAYVPLLRPMPEIQAWLAYKRAIEQVYGREHCTVPEPDEAALKRDAKAELQRLLKTFGGRFDAARQAQLAEYVSLEDLTRFEWAGWNEAGEELKAAHAAELLHRGQ